MGKKEENEQKLSLVLECEVNLSTMHSNFGRENRSFTRCPQRGKKQRTIFITHAPRQPKRLETK